MIIRTDERIKETGEVFTPPALVDQILDQLPNEVWFDHTKTWLEPSCGDGNFLVAILQRLMKHLRHWQPDDTLRHKHIIENMLYGVDLMEDNVKVCIDRLSANGLSHNIVCADGLTYDYSFGRPISIGGIAEVDSEDPKKAKERAAVWSKPQKNKKTEQDLPPGLFG